MKNINSQYSPPETKDQMDLMLTKYSKSATNVLRCGRGQEGIARFLHHVEGMSKEEAIRLSYPLFDVAKLQLKRSQFLKLLIGVFLLSIGIIGPIVLYFSELGFFIISSIPIIAGIALLKTLIHPEPIEDAALLNLD